MKRCEGPFVVTNVQGKVIFVDQEGKSKQYSIGKVKPLSEIKDDDTVTRANQHVDQSKSSLATLRKTTMPIVSTVKAKITLNFLLIILQIQSPTKILRTT